MAQRKGQSYPTIRNRLNAIIALLGVEAPPLAQRQHEILDAIAKGELTVEQATKLLKEVGK
jgi:hypothetical protein